MLQTFAALVTNFRKSEESTESHKAPVLRHGFPVPSKKTAWDSSLSRDMQEFIPLMARGQITKKGGGQHINDHIRCDQAAAEPFSGEAKSRLKRRLAPAKMAAAICPPTAAATGGGKALPTCR